MGIRQLVWALIALLLLYGGWQILRSLLAGRKASRNSQEAVRGPDPAQGAALAADQSSSAAAWGEAAGVEPVDADDDNDYDYAPVPAATAPALTPAPQPSPPPPVSPDVFAIELELQRLRRELGAVRAALDVQQEEIGALHETVRLLSEQPPALAQATEQFDQNASPEYSEALVLARRGLSVEDISTRCGITRAEAELVVSLAARGEGEGGA